MKGEIIVYTGPMFGSKTLALLSAYERATIARKKVKAFKPRLDNRFGESAIKSRSFKDAEIKAINIENISELRNYDAEVYIIDEFEFLKGDPQIIREMADLGKKFHISGLDMTAEGKPFGPMPDLMSYADRVIKYTAVCDGCGEDAIYSFFKGINNEDIVVGNSEYVPLCRDCWLKSMSEKEQKKNEQSRNK